MGATHRKKVANLLINLPQQINNADSTIYPLIRPSSRTINRAEARTDSRRWTRSLPDDKTPWSYYIASRITKQPVADSATIFESTMQIAGRRLSHDAMRDSMHVECLNYSPISGKPTRTINNDSRLVALALVHLIISRSLRYREKKING